MIRVNYILRALPVPEGKHIITFRFDPQSIKITDSIAYAALFIMLLTALILFCQSLKGKRDTEA